MKTKSVKFKKDIKERKQIDRRKRERGVGGDEKEGQV